MRCALCGEPEDSPQHNINCPDDAGYHDFTLPRRLTRHEQLQHMADAGCDTWEDYRGEN